jgi:hypothetical protein
LVAFFLLLLLKIPHLVFIKDKRTGLLIQGLGLKYTEGRNSNSAEGEVGFGAENAHLDRKSLKRGNPCRGLTLLDHSQFGLFPPKSVRDEVGGFSE